MHARPGQFSRFFLVLGLLVGTVSGTDTVDAARERLTSESSSSRREAEASDPVVTVYLASWCSACKDLVTGLTSRDIPFSPIDVERDRAAYDKAKKATGKNVIPITSVERGDGDVVWIVGSDVDAVEHAYRRGR